MSIHRTLAIGLRQYYVMRGNLSRLLPLFLWVGVDVVLWGFITKYLSSVASTGPNFSITILGAVLLWDFLIRVMQGVTTAFLEDVWSRNFLNLFATPLSISEYIGGLVIVSVVTSVIGLATMFALAAGCFGVSFFSYGTVLLPALIILFVSGIGLGVLACAMVLRLGPSGEWFVWPIPAVVSSFVGVFYPLSTLPRWMRWIGRALPPSYVFESLRSIVGANSVGRGSLYAGAGLATGYLLLACFFFTRIYRHAVRTGLIARYSAEI